MPQVYMFSYGMNTNLSGMLMRCERATPLGVFCLRDHRFDFRYHADVVYSPGDQVWGMLWSLNDDDFAAIDRVEGYPNYYTRKQVTVGNDDMQVRNVWVYHMQVQDEVLYPPQHYWDMVLEGYEENDIPVGQLYSALERCEESYVWKEIADVEEW